MGPPSPASTQYNTNVFYPNTLQPSAGVMLAFTLELKTAVRRSVAIPPNYDPRKSSNKQLYVLELCIIVVGIV